MAQIIPFGQQMNEEPDSTLHNQPDSSTLSAHLQATLPLQETSRLQEHGSGGSPLLPQLTQFSSASVSGSPTPRDRSPNRLRPYASSSRTKSALKFSPSGNRLADTQTNEEVTDGSKVLPGMEDEQIANSTYAATPHRKSVQFTRGLQDTETASPESRTPGDDERPEPEKPFSLYNKLRALATSQAFAQSRTTSSTSIKRGPVDGRSSDNTVTLRSSNEAGLTATLEEDSDADADAEESAAEGASDLLNPRKRRRKMLRADKVESAPSSPHSPMHYFSSNHSPGPSIKPSLLRRATDGETTNMRKGLSEDEGLKQNVSPTAWTPRHPLRGISYGGQRRTNEGTPEGRDVRRPLTLLNLGTIASSRGPDPSIGGASGDTPTKSRRRQLAQRGSTLSAAKWKQIKNSLKLIGQSKKKEKTQDQKKSAELLAELAAGGPAALMLASMFQRDEHGSRRIPVLLEQLKVNITDSELIKYKEAGNPTPSDRHIIFRIELEYGNGINRMRWVIRRSLADFWSLHSKYKTSLKFQSVKGKTTDKKLPRFPREAFPFLKLFGSSKDMADDDGEEEEAARDADGPLTDTERPGLATRQSSRPFYGVNRRRSSIGSQADGGVHTPGGTLVSGNATRRDLRHAEKQREELAKYLRRMIHFMLFRPDANRLCKFLEVSALGMRLAAEGSYHGKEGFLVIRSAKGLDFRKALTPTNVTMRHSPKWFLVRHSYIVCVDSPEGMNIYDVFLFDSDFKLQAPRLRNQESKGGSKTAKQLAISAKESARHPQHHRLKIYNSERKLKLLAANERQLAQFEESIRLMVETSPWAKKNRFDSFAPVRPNCFAQWLVDGRDYMWVVSRALNQAKDVIYIHDWWLSPELYMRRPPAISQKWRLDRLLKRKAEQGVKVFIIVYRNIDAAIPIDSQYTKFSLLDLHPNVFVQRSPNQFRQNTFFWAHHEKLCIVDHTLAFVGGIDLCFGRWDTPQHILTDDKPTGFDLSEVPKDSDHCQLWPGKDYSNPRIQDFYALNKPYEEMYDRTRVPRMPWHDISMQVVGQPARDLTRHFVQRWNYILRQRKPTRPTPFLLPPPDFNAADLEALGLDGTCEVQILRSAGPWSLGTPDKTEHSIMNAYVKMIEESEHFVYMENQFFISSCVTEGATVYNKIGDALVERITRAAKNHEDWRAVIVIPLIPGFQNTVEQEGGTSVRLIMQYQFRSICRGESSIFGRLRAQGIEPEDYIQFYSLRQWGKLGVKQTLVSEQLYIHAKCIIVDDRIALIGSANVNERSMLGNRDSECAAVVRDTDMVWSTMNGKPYRVARFAHTLRMRLMREHLGLDVDKIMEDSQAMEAEHRKHAGKEYEQRPQSPDDDAEDPNDKFDDNLSPLAQRGKEIREELLYRSEKLSSFNGDVDWEQQDNPNLRSNRKLTEDSRVTGNSVHRSDVEGHGHDNMAEIDKAGLGIGRDTVIIKDGKELLVTDLDTEGKNTLQSPRPHGDQPRLSSYVVKRETPEPPLPPRPSTLRKNTEQLGLSQLSQLPPLPELDDTDIGGPALERASTRGSNGVVHHLLSDMKKPLVDRDCMQDPIHDAFVDDIWHTVAENNTKIFRAVFRCMPDNLVRDWDDYHHYMAYEQRFNQLQGNDAPLAAKVPNLDADRPQSRTGPPGVGVTGTASAQVKRLVKVPTDLADTSDMIKEKIKGAFNDHKENEKTPLEHDDLRDWAANLNRQQMQRQGQDLSARSDEAGALDEKAAGLATVPEDGSAPQSSHGSEATRAISSQSNTTPEKTPTSVGTGLPETLSTNQLPPQTRRRRRGTTRSSRRDFNATDDILSVVEAEELLNNVQGQLVEWPYDWLDRVEAGSNWLFPFDQISPIEIYI